MEIQLEQDETSQGLTTVFGEEKKRSILFNKQSVLINQACFKEELPGNLDEHAPNLILENTGCSSPARDLTLLSPYGSIGTLSSKNSVYSPKKNLPFHWVQTLTTDIFNIEPFRKVQTAILKPEPVLAIREKPSVQVNQSFPLEHVADKEAFLCLHT